MSQLPTLMKLIDAIRALFSRNAEPDYPPPPRWDDLYAEEAAAPDKRSSRSIALGRRGRPVATPRRAA